MSILDKAIWFGVLGGVLCSHSSLVHAAPTAQLPGAQQQRAIDTEKRRQQKQLQLDALEDKRRRQQEESAEHPAPLVVVPEEVKAPVDGKPPKIDGAPSEPASPEKSDSPQ